MKRSAVRFPFKFVPLALGALILGACSGHQYSDPTNKYGALNQIATDSELKDVERPSAVGTNPVRIDAAQEFAENSTSSFEVKVTLPYQGFEYDLMFNAGGVGSFQPSLTSQSGLTDTWEVSWTIPEILLKDEVYRTVKLEAIVRYTSFPNETIRSRYARIQPSEWTSALIVRKSAIPEFVQFRLDSEGDVAELGSILEFEALLDPKGFDRQQLVLSAKASLVECKSSVLACAKVNKVDIGPWDGANGNLRALGSLDLRSLKAEDIGISAGDELQLRLDLTVTYADAQTVTKSKFITVLPKNELATPTVQWEGVSSQVEQGGDYEVSFSVSTAGATAEVTLDENSGITGVLECESAVEATLCQLAGRVSCESELGQISLPVTVTVQRGQEKKATEGRAQLEILASAACQE